MQLLVNFWSTAVVFGVALPFEVTHAGTEAGCLDAATP